MIIGTATAQADAEERWLNLKKMVFGDRPVAESSGVIDIKAPARAYNAALVPISVKALIPQGPERHIRTLYLIVDNNPLPLAGTFKFKPNIGWASIETRIRINEYTHVRAVAETSDNQLYMAKTFVKASGGCSAPASSDQQAALARLGKMKLILDEAIVPAHPTTAQFLISHPNNSGMQFDQISRNYIPAHFLRTIVARFNGAEIFTLDSNFSLSEDPSIHFSFVPTRDGELTVRVVDSKNNVFENTWPVDVDEQALANSAKDGESPTN